MAGLDDKDSLEHDPIFDMDVQVLQEDWLELISVRAFLCECLWNLWLPANAKPTAMILIRTHPESRCNSPNIHQRPEDNMTPVISNNRTTIHLCASFAFK